MCDVVRLPAVPHWARDAGPPRGGLAPPCRCQSGTPHGAPSSGVAPVDVANSRHRIQIGIVVFSGLIIFLSLSIICNNADTIASTFSVLYRRVYDLLSRLLNLITSQFRMFVINFACILCSESVCIAMLRKNPQHFFPPFAHLYLFI